MLDITFILTDERQFYNNSGTLVTLIHTRAHTIGVSGLT